MITAYTTSFVALLTMLTACGSHYEMTLKDDQNHKASQYLHEDHSFFKSIAQTNTSCTQGLIIHQSVASGSEIIFVEGTVWNVPNCDYYDRVPTDSIGFAVTQVQSSKDLVTIEAQADDKGKLKLVWKLESERWRLTLEDVPNAPADGFQRNGTFKEQRH